MAGRVLTLSQARSPLASAAEQLRTLGRIPITRSFDDALAPAGLSPLRARTIDVLQINVGKVCNQTCRHCHVDAGPARREIMSRETMALCLRALDASSIPTVDITGGAPELNPHFRFLVEECKEQNRHVIDRCNLTILFEPGQEGLAEFLAGGEVEIVASLPCYDVQNVDVQRGNGVFEKSIRALQVLNALGYGRKPELKLNLVYNPLGAQLPLAQSTLEAEFKAQLHRNYGISFDNLYAITNMPIARFATFLRNSDQWQEYSSLLVNSFNPAAVDGLMCRDTISVGWRGEVYDCDFNQMLNLQWRNGKPLFLWDVDMSTLGGHAIETGAHCFGCTAGSGSSCGGALM